MAIAVHNIDARQILANAVPIGIGGAHKMYPYRCARNNRCLERKPATNGDVGFCGERLRQLGLL